MEAPLAGEPRLVHQSLQVPGGPATSNFGDNPWIIKIDNAAECCIVPATLAKLMRWPIFPRHVLARSFTRHGLQNHGTVVARIKVHNHEN